MARQRDGDGQDEHVHRILGPREARSLFDAIAQSRMAPGRWFKEVLAPAMPAWSGFAEEYARYRRLASAPPFPGGGHRWQSDSWTLYALSRMFDYLVIDMQKRAGLHLLDTDGPRPDYFSVLPRHELVEFFSALGMQPIAPRLDYHPFFHEIADAVRDPALDGAILVDEEVWPGFWFGDLVFARAGVRVRYGPDVPFNLAVATRSTLYFTWRREYRPTRDLSHGWGSGSQWATEFRRDYADGTMLHYNVDGRVRLTGDGAIVPPSPPHLSNQEKYSGDLTPAERIELLTHRCFVRTAKRHDDRWPFDDTYAEPAV